MRNIWSVAGAAAVLFATAAQAATTHYAAKLTGAAEVPPVAGPGSGMLSADLDAKTRTLRYRLMFSNLSGPAVGAHIHGPAAAGTNGPPVLMISMDRLTSPHSGAMRLSREQVGDLKAGQLYVNVHTAAHSDGEIRGQILPAAK